MSSTPHIAVTVSFDNVTDHSIVTLTYDQLDNTLLLYELLTTQKCTISKEVESKFMSWFEANGGEEEFMKRYEAATLIMHDMAQYSRTSKNNIRYTSH